MHLALSPPPPLRRTINYDDIKNVVKLRSLLRSFWSPSASVRARARHPLFFLSFSRSPVPAPKLHGMTLNRNNE